jgi:hypothetical protein
MKGYEIFEERHLKRYREDGIAPHEIRIGLLDFLRELRGGMEGIPSFSSYMVVGIDDVLYLAGSDMRTEVALTIHKTLQSAAQKLEKKKSEVQIVCKGKLMKGESLWLEYRKEKLPIDYIFGTTTKREVHGNPVYATGFNLSS